MNLELRLLLPPNPGLDDVVHLGLFAVSNDGADQPMAGLDAILGWDAEVFFLTGKLDNGPFPWASSWFPNDRNLDRLNADCGPDVFCVPYRGLPYNDGDAFYQAFVVALDPAPTATAEGLLVTTFVFHVMSPACHTTVALLASGGQVSTTRVVIGGPDGTREITGALGSYAAEIEACGTRGDFDGDCRVTLPDFTAHAVCLTGPDGSVSTSGCRPADADGDEDADLRDTAAMQRRFDCP